MSDEIQEHKIDRNQVINLLHQIHLFHNMDDNDINRLADMFSVFTFDNGVEIFEQDTLGDSFYIILNGSVKIVRFNAYKEELLATLVAGDYFGEESLLMGGVRSASVYTTSPSTLLYLGKTEFKQMLDLFPQVGPNLETIIQSRRLFRKQKLNWLGDDEVVYLLARKHVTLLVPMLFPPIIVALFSIPLFAMSVLTSIITPALFGGLLLLGMIAWGAWRVIDWGNDYYIVTNQRVVWLEKIIGLHDSRQEAPLSTVLSVSMETDPLGRVLGYGDVIVRTYTGRIIMRHVGHPNEMKSLIEEYWQRTKKITSRSEEKAMVTAIRDRLGIPPKREKQDPFTPKPLPIPPSSKVENPTPFQLLIASYFSTRFIDGSVITYRKHWYLFARSVWWQTLAIIGIVFFVIARFFGYYPFLSIESVNVIGLALITVLGGVWIYSYVDWRDDKFQVTSDHIVDIDRKPFGKEEKKSAPLENILSLEHTRAGISGILFNFGDVSATVGGSQFVFEGVHDPAQVQQDIFVKMDARIKKKKDAEAASERARMSAWLAAYHKNVEDFYQIPSLSNDEGIDSGPKEI